MNAELVERVYPRRIYCKARDLTGDEAESEEARQGEKRPERGDLMYVGQIRA